MFRLNRVVKTEAFTARIDNAIYSLNRLACNATPCRLSQNRQYHIQLEQTISCTAWTDSTMHIKPEQTGGDHGTTEEEWLLPVWQEVIIELVRSDCDLYDRWPWAGGKSLIPVWQEVTMWLVRSGSHLCYRRRGGGDHGAHEEWLLPVCQEATIGLVRRQPGHQHRISGHWKYLRGIYSHYFVVKFTCNIITGLLCKFHEDLYYKS